YHWAAVRYRASHQGCKCELRTSGMEGCQLSLSAAFDSSAAKARSGTRQAWLLERYRAFVPPLQAAVEHPPWSFQLARVELGENTLGCHLGMDLNRPPDEAHFCREMQARFSRFSSCTRRVLNVP
ncbi:MAG TPA: DUF2071 domain-containing protein, partial [Pirellulaceae bacterium]|nr:DUF2071 domain-containing protein [Pirellulaceae bacterium]